MFSIEAQSISLSYQTKLDVIEVIVVVPIVIIVVILEVLYIFTGIYKSIIRSR